MKKISYLFLSLVMAIAVGGSVVSCKDYEEDLRAEFGAEVDNLNEIVSGAEGLVGAIDKLEDEIAKQEQALKDSIKNLFDNPETGGVVTKNDLDDLKSELSLLYATKTELTATKTELQGAIDDAKTALEGQIEGLDARILALEAQVCVSCSCADKISDLLTRVGKLEGWQNTVNTAINTILPNDIAEALGAANAAKTEAAVNAAAIKEDSVLFAAADEALNKRVDDLRDAYNLAIDTINGHISDLNQIVATFVTKEEFYDSVAVLSDSVYNLSTLLNALDAKVLLNTDKISELKIHVDTTIVRFTDSIAAIRGEINTIQTNVSQLTQKYNELSGRVDKIENYLEKLITGILVQSVRNPLYGTFALPVNVSNNVLAGFYGDLSSATQFPTARAGYYADLSGTILSERDLQMMNVKAKTIAKGRITSENLGTVYLTINPTNVDFSGVKFELVNSLDENSGVTLSDLKKSDKKLTFGWSRAANNGFYETTATIEPENVENIKARVDLSGVKDVVKDVLTPTNGISVSNVAKVVANNFTDILDANALKASWEVYKDITDTTQKEMMAVYSQYSIAATAVKPLSYAFLQDLDIQEIPGIGRAEDLLNKLFDKVSVEVEGALPTIDVSKYYNFLEFRDLSFENVKDTITGETEIDIKANVSVEVDIPAGVFPGQEVEIWDRRDPSNPILIDKVTINPSNSETAGGTGTATVKDTITFNVSIKEFLDGVETDFNEWIIATEKDFSDNLNSLLDELNQINEISDKANEALGNIQNTLVNYLDKFNNKLTGLVNSANKALQPVLLIKTNDGFARMSQAKGSPTLVNGTSLTLIPTSYTAELIAPAYKRLVGVTNVYTANYSANAQAGDAACLAELQTVNGQKEVAEVLPGSRTTIPVTIKKGYVYEFAYTVVDYTGLVVAKKCYVKAQ